MEIYVEGYQILSKLGEGAMAEVYRARHEKLEREVALKVIKPEFVADGNFIERFYKEAKIAAKLSHPNVIQIFDVDNFEQGAYISMELLDQSDLASVMGEQISLGYMQSILNQICNALDYAHQKGYIHRDIKPSNIVFRDAKKDEVVICDFGIARALDGDSDLTKTGSVLGTPMYMSPEQVKGLKLDGRSDLYAVGVLLYRWLTGKPLFQSNSSFTVALKHINEPIPALPDDLLNLKSFFDKALAKNKENRYKNGKELYQAFCSIAHEKNVLVGGSAAEKNNISNDQLSTKISAANLKVDMRTIEHAELSLNLEDQAPPDQTGRTGGRVIKLAIASSLILAVVGFVMPALESQSIKKSLKEANFALENGLILPETPNSAYAKYIEVLKRDRKNGAAFKGLLKVSEALLDRARLNIESEDVSVSQESISASAKTLELLKKNARLKHLAHPEVSLALESLSKELALLGLLQSAREAFDNGRFAPPQKSSAWEEYEKAQQIDADSVLIKKGKSRVKTELHRLAMLSISEGNVDEAKILMEQLSSVTTIEERFDIELAYRERLKRQKRTSHKNSEIEMLFGKANNAIVTGSIRAADKIWNEIYAARPEDQRLVELSGEIADGYADFAQREFEAGDWRDAQIWARLGLNHVPDHEVLLSILSSASSKNRDL